VTLGELGGEVLDAKAFAGEEDDEVIEHVGTFVDETVIGAVGGFDDEFEGLLAYLLCHAVETVAEEAGGVGAFGHLFVTTVDEVLKLGEEEEWVTLVDLAPAGVGAGVADGAGGIGLDEEGVVVAVVENLDDAKHIAGGLAFGPQLLAAPAEEGHQPGGKGLLYGLGIHIAQHQHFAGLGVLDNNGQ